MAYKPPFQSYKEKLDKKKKRSPIILGILSVLLIGAGVILIWTWFNAEGGPQISLFQPKTPTPTNTPTSPPPTATSTKTAIPTETLVPSITPTGTPAVPFEYQVQSGDNLSIIAEKFGVEEIVLIMVVNGLTGGDFLSVGQILTIPNPDMVLPTSTIFPTDIVPGDFIEYMVLPGDSVQAIAEAFYSTEEEIIEVNELENSYLIHPGDILLIPYWIVTPTYGPPPDTATPIP